MVHYLVHMVILTYLHSNRGYVIRIILLRLNSLDCCTASTMFYVTESPVWKWAVRP